MKIDWCKILDHKWRRLLLKNNTVHLMAVYCARCLYGKKEIDDTLENLLPCINTYEVEEYWDADVSTIAINKKPIPRPTHVTIIEATSFRMGFYDISQQKAERHNNWLNNFEEKIFKIRMFGYGKVVSPIPKKMILTHYLVSHPDEETMFWIPKSLCEIIN